MPLSQDVPANQRNSVLMGPAPLRLGVVVPLSCLQESSSLKLSTVIVAAVRLINQSSGDFED
jgi:hypothetical protein